MSRAQTRLQSTSGMRLLCHTQYHLNNYMHNYSGCQGFQTGDDSGHLGMKCAERGDFKLQVPKQDMLFCCHGAEVGAVLKGLSCDHAGTMCQWWTVQCICGRPCSSVPGCVVKVAAMCAAKSRIVFGPGPVNIGYCYPLRLRELCTRALFRPNAASMNLLVDCSLHCTELEHLP